MGTIATFSLTEHVSDDANLMLSELQVKNLASWVRIESLLQPLVPPNLLFEDALMQAQPDCDLVQDVTTDCSIVASLSAAVKILTGKHHAVLIPFNQWHFAFVT